MSDLFGNHIVGFPTRRLVFACRLQLPIEPQHAHKMAPPDWPSQGGVIFRDVVMRYRPDMDPVLRSVSFEIRPQEKVGVIGRTGAGILADYHTAVT